MLGNSALSGSMATQLMARADGCDGTAPDGKLSSGEFIAGLHGIGDGAFLRVSVHLSLYIYRALSLSLSLSLTHTHTHVLHGDAAAEGCESEVTHVGAEPTQQGPSGRVFRVWASLSVPFL